jgi:hypothetical protein
MRRVPLLLLGAIRSRKSALVLAVLLLWPGAWGLISVTSRPVIPEDGSTMRLLSDQPTPPMLLNIIWFDNGDMAVLVNLAKPSEDPLNYLLILDDGHIWDADKSATPSIVQLPDGRLALPPELLYAVTSSLAFDYVARQKHSGANMQYFLVKQLACPAPMTFESRAEWCLDYRLADWLRGYVLELSYTSWQLLQYARDLGDTGPPFRWNPERRALLRGDLDAAFMHVYGLTRPEVEHVLDSFFVVRKYEERDFGEFRTRRLVLEAYDRMAAAIARGGMGWEPLAGIPAGQGPRHSDRPANKPGEAR